MLYKPTEIFKGPVATISLSRIIALLVTLLLVLSPLAANAWAAEVSNGSRTIRVGYFPVDGFQEYNRETGAYSGYSYEFLMAIAAYGNWQYEFVPCSNFTDAYERLEKGQIDLLNDVAKREGRDTIEYSNLSAGIGCSYLLMRPGDNRVAYNDWEGIGRLHIGLDKESSHSNRLLAILKEHGVEPRVTWYSNESMTIEAWKAGLVDAFPAHSDTAIEGHSIMIFDPRMYYLAATKGNKELIGQVDHAIQALRSNDPSFEATLQNKYYNRVSRNYTVLTVEEQNYIKEHPVVRVLYVPNWYPLSYQDKEGNFQGPFREIYKLLQERTGLQYEFVPLDSSVPFKGIVETYDCYMLAEHPIDYVGAGKFDVKLTQAFVKAALVEVSRGTLKKGDTVALVKGDSLSDIAKKIFGDSFKYVMVNSIEDSMGMVQNGTVDGTILMSYESEYYQAQSKYRNLIYTIVNSGSYGFGLAVSNKADPLLYSITVKGLNSITDGEINNIFNQMSQDLRKPTLWSTVQENPLTFAGIGILLAAIAVFGFSGLYFGRKIKEKNDQLIKANTATNQFFASMSHDMRTPMNGILGIAELSKGDTDVEALHKEMDKIQQSGKYLLSLINDTLDFQRIESGNLKIEKELVPAREVFENIIELVAPSAKSKGLRLEVLSKDQVPDCYIWADPVRLKQIFVNLLSNAIKFTPEGGSVIVGYESKGQDSTKLKGSFIVRDTGVGMSKEFIAGRMYNPFCQEHNAATGKYAGSGLGLSIVKSLVELMNGTITVESELGKGTTFRVDLELDKATPAELEQHKVTEIAAEQPSVHSLQGIRILLAEDHPLNAEIATRLLKKAGCQVEWAKDGKEALELFGKAEDGYYNVVLMDIRMPIMDGLDATRAIRVLDKPGAKTVPIIAMTANAYETDVNACLQAGMNAHLAKPIEPKRLYETLSKYC